MWIPRNCAGSKVAIFFLGLMLIPSLVAAVEKSDLKLGGQSISRFGKKACTPSSEMVEVALPNSATQTTGGFRALIKTATQADKAKADGGCDDKVSEKARLDIDFTKGSPKIDINKFLEKAQCEPKATPGSRVLCIYNDDGSKLLSFNVFDHDITQAQIENITNRSAANNEVSFTVKSKGTSSGVKIKVCFGKASDGTIEGDDCPKPFEEKTYNSPEISITGLDNNVEYRFKVRLIDAKDGEGDWTDPFNETPIPVAFALNTYNGKGGDLAFNCNQSGQGSGVFLLMALLMMVLVRRMSTASLSPRIMAPLFLLLVSLTEAPLAHAEFGQMNIGLLGAMYRPDLDNELTSSGEKIFPFYKCFFRRSKSDNNGPINPLIGIEFDWHLWDKLGTVQLGFGTSYTFVTGRALQLNADNEPDCDAPLENSKVSLHMYQLRPQLTYLFNPFAEHFPLVPYVRGALVGQGYMFFKNGKSDTGSTSIKPNGFRFGYQAAVGMMLMLDFLEPGAVRSARGEGLFNHVYLKGELAYTKIDSFGRPGFNFSAKDVMGTDWPLMWTFGLVFELP